MESDSISPFGHEDSLPSVFNHYCKSWMSPVLTQPMWWLWLWRCRGQINSGTQTANCKVLCLLWVADVVVVDSSQTHTKTVIDLCCSETAWSEYSPDELTRESGNFCHLQPQRELFLITPKVPSVPLTLQVTHQNSLIEVVRQQLKTGSLGLFLTSIWSESLRIECLKQAGWINSC